MIPSSYYSQNVNLLNLADDGPYDSSDYDEFNQRISRRNSNDMNLNNFNYIPDTGRYQNEISEPNFYPSHDNSADGVLYTPDHLLNNSNQNYNNNNYYNNNFNNVDQDFENFNNNYSEGGSIAGSTVPYNNNINNRINNSSNNNLFNNSNSFNNFLYNNNNNNQHLGNIMPIDMISNASRDLNPSLQPPVDGRLTSRSGSGQMYNNNNRDLIAVKSAANPDRPYSRNSNINNKEKRISPYVLSSDPPGLLNSSYRPQSTSALNRSHSTNPFNPDLEDKLQRPDLTEVIDFLSHHNDGVKANAAAYLQHLCYMDDNAKVQTRVLRGIPPLLELVTHPKVEVHRSACGALRNISYGRANDDNKREIKNLGGITTLVRLVRRTSDEEILELVTGIIWNLSSCSDIKKHIIDESLKALMDQVIIPYSGKKPSLNQFDANRFHYRSTVFRNASGVLRNVSSDGEYARKKMRECEGLISSLAYVVGVSLTKQDCDNKSIENCVCVLRNLSYACQEVADPDYLKNRLLMVSGKDGKSGCFGNKSKSSNNKKMDAHRNNQYPSDQWKQNSEMSYLWSPKILDIYLPLLKDCSNPDTVEATAGAIQNLAACDWQPSVEIRTAVRQEHGLPILISLLGYSSDKVIYSATTALRNLAIDDKNKELIGKCATKDLTTKLPTSSEPTEFILSNDTIAAVESTLYEVVKSNSSFAKLFINEGGVTRLMNITKSPPGIFDEKVIRYAKQLLQKIWKYNEFHDDLKRAGWKPGDFTFATTGGKSSAENTINRPIMNQGRGYQDNSAKFNNNNVAVYNNNNNNNKPNIKFDNGNVKYSAGNTSMGRHQMMTDEDIALDVLQNMELNDKQLQYPNNNNNQNMSYNVYSPNVLDEQQQQQQQYHHPYKQQQQQQYQQQQQRNVNNSYRDGNKNVNNTLTYNTLGYDNKSKYESRNNYMLQQPDNNINNNTFNTLPGQQYSRSTLQQDVSSYNNFNDSNNYNNNNNNNYLGDNNEVVIGDSDVRFISGAALPNSSSFNENLSSPLYRQPGPMQNAIELSVDQLYSKVQHNNKNTNIHKNNNDHSFI